MPRDVDPVASHMTMRLTPDDQIRYMVIKNALESKLGTRLSTAALFRMGLRALAAVHNIKV